MNNELVKKLNDAGFPIIKHANRGPESREYVQILSGEERLRILYIPTLSELIEACGDTEIGIYKYRFSKNGECKWEADNDPTDRRDGEHVIYTRGKTPEEAVALLWLALNQK